jgi:hypothetical protein
VLRSHDISNFTLTSLLIKLASMFLRGSSTPEASRWISGVGLRVAQDMGAHRKKTYSTVPNLEDELLKKAFWWGHFLITGCALTIQAHLGLWYGSIGLLARRLGGLAPYSMRSTLPRYRYYFGSTFHSYSFDVDLPLECDDEYYDPPNSSCPRFRQPAGKPAMVTFFNYMLKLTQIQAYALRTLVCNSGKFVF